MPSRGTQDEIMHRLKTGEKSVRTLREACPCTDKTFYTVLQRLEIAGIIESWWGTVGFRKRRATMKIYKIRVVGDED